MTPKSPAVADAWAKAAAALPPDWEPDGLRCASTGLSPEDRSEEWIALTNGPDGQEIRHQTEDPIVALEGLVTSFREAQR